MDRREAIDNESPALKKVEEIFPILNRAGGKIDFREQLRLGEIGHHQSTRVARRYLIQDEPRRAGSDREGITHRGDTSARRRLLA